MNTVLFQLDERTEFSEFSSVKEPISACVSQTRTALETENDLAFMGIWECTPGQWRRQVLQAEYSYFIEGSGSFTHDHGEVVNFKSGDSIFFPPNSTGIWDITSTVQKSYVIFK